jgi:hypothetical protein
VLTAGSVAAWGEGIELVPLTGGKPRSIITGRYGRGGCEFDGGLFLNESAKPGEPLETAVFVTLDSGRAQLVDTHADFRDCLEAELFGRRGVLVTHRQMQLRFYERPGSPGERWPYREIYSIYTASAQSGLALMDVDRDGWTDIIHGNYWVQSPSAFERSWRIFAFNNWWDQPRSAMLRIAISGGEVIAAESEASPARIARFTKPDDPKQFWREAFIEVPGGVKRPGALAVHGGAVLAGEDRGAGSRLWTIQAGQASVLETSSGYLEIWPDQGLALTRSSIQRYRRK